MSASRCDSCTGQILIRAIASGGNVAVALSDQRVGGATCMAALLRVTCASNESFEAFQ